MALRLTVVPHFGEKQTPVPLGQLPDNEAAYLVSSFTGDGEPSLREKELAMAVLDGLARKRAWLMCHCTGHADGPILYPQRTRGGGRMLVRNYDRREHVQECPFYRLRSERTTPAPAGPLTRHTGAFGILKESLLPDATAPKRDGRAQPAERVPMLRRLLFRMLEEANIHRVPATGPANIYEQNNRLRDLLDRLYFDDEQTVPLKKFAFISLEHLNWMQERLAKTKPWPKPLEPQGFMIGTVIETTDRTISTKSGVTLTIAGKVARFGEEGTAGPFIAMVLVGLNPENHCYEPLRSYVHPVASSSLLIPVDSNLERRTLDVLMDLQSWLHADKGIDVVIEKPLADTPTGHDSPSVRPDFLLQLNGKTVVVETMGYDNAEYLASKQRTHPLMERIGPVILHRAGEQADKTLKSDAAKAIYAILRS